jgi:hypothetical protein
VTDADVAAIRKLPAGIYPQVYRGKVPGKTRADRLSLLRTKVRTWAQFGARGVAWHGFTTELDAAKLEELTAICRDFGLLSLAAYGMDSSDPTGKGERIGRVLVSEHCDGVLLDAEGAFEDTKDGDDHEHARQLGVALKPFRDQVPHKVIVDQPWAVPVRVRGQGGHGRFPYKEFAAICDAHAEQDYLNDWIRTWGQQRYAKCMPLFNESWALLEAQLAALGLKLPRWRTIQGYSWGDIPADLADYLTRYASAVPVFVWGEPFPDDAFMAVWRELHEQVTA